MLLPFCLVPQGWQCTQCPRPLALTCFLVKFFGFDWYCWSALHDAICLSLCLGRSQSLQEGYIHWLMPAGAALLVTWSGAATQWCPAGSSVPAVWPAVGSPGFSFVQSERYHMQKVVLMCVQQKNTDTNFLPHHDSIIFDNMCSTFCTLYLNQSV